ncbi:MAG: nucleotidyltransferase domain-containing protein, partial [Nanoarchaeota archaeon]
MSLLQFLKTNKDTRKIFGKRELKIIEKQLLGINLTQSEKNRLSRDIRKKFNFIKYASRFEGEFELKKAAEIKKKINATKNIILQDPLHFHIKNIKIFGSFVDNTMTFRSDIDIAVTFDEITLKEATLFRKRIFGESPEQIDVQVYNVL